MIMSTERVIVSLDLTIFDVPQLIERLRESSHAGVRSVADQIASQTKPPTPAEPTDPAVRVHDADMDVWASYDGEWYCLTSRMRPRSWPDLVDGYGPLEVRP